MRTKILCYNIDIFFFFRFHSSGIEAILTTVGRIVHPKCIGPHQGYDGSIPFSVHFASSTLNTVPCLLLLV